MKAANNIFVQVGATRDGLDLYLDCAKKRNLHSVLLETPNYLALRKDLSRRHYDSEISVKDPASIPNITEVLQAYKNNIVLMLPGFECYVPATYAVAQLLKTLPYNRDQQSHFEPPNKDVQRDMLRKYDPAISQPNFTIIKMPMNKKILDNFEYPLVVKPVNGAGGLGVYLANNREELINAIDVIKKLKNYNGSKFDKIIIEKYIKGKEMSIQGVCFNGYPVILSYCEKIIKLEADSKYTVVNCFREAGHVAFPGNQLPGFLYDFVNDIVKAFNYKTGPFHIDFVMSNDKPYFLEMGYRLSGGAIVELVQKTTGINWAELSFSSYLKENIPDNLYINNNQKYCFGVATIQTKLAIEIAKSLKQSGSNIDIKIFKTNLSTIAKNKTLSKQLSADLTRHGAALGRLWIRAKTPEEVLNLIRICQGLTN